FTRFVNKTIAKFRVGSIQKLVPVNPVWPKVFLLVSVPAELKSLLLRSNPYPRLASFDCRWVNMLTIEGLIYRLPPYEPLFSNIWAKTATSELLEKSPAWPETPSI